MTWISCIVAINTSDTSDMCSSHWKKAALRRNGSNTALPSRFIAAIAMGSYVPFHV